MKTIVTAAIAALIPFAAAAQDGVSVLDAYARGSNPKTGAAFMVIENHRTTDCTLQGVASDAAQRVELHTHKEENGVMKMMRIEDGITVPAQSSHALQRGGDHVMFMGLRAPLQDGQMITISLDFGDCGTQEVQVPVDNRRQPDPAAMKMQHGAGMGGGTRAPSN